MNERPERSFNSDERELTLDQLLLKWDSELITRETSTIQESDIEQLVKNIRYVNYRYLETKLRINIAKQNSDQQKNTNNESEVKRLVDYGDRWMRIKNLALVVALRMRQEGNTNIKVSYGHETIDRRNQRIIFNFFQDASPVPYIVKSSIRNLKLVTTKKELTELIGQSDPIFVGSDPSILPRRFPI